MAPKLRTQLDTAIAGNDTFEVEEKAEAGTLENVYPVRKAATKAQGPIVVIDGVHRTVGAYKENKRSVGTTRGGGFSIVKEADHKSRSSFQYFLYSRGIMSIP